MHFESSNSFHRNKMFRFVTNPVLGSRQLTRYNDWLRAGRPSDQGSSLCGVQNFHFSISSRPDLRPIQSPIRWATGALSLGVKRPGREVVHSHQTSAEVKITQVYTSTSPQIMAWRLVKHRDGFTITYKPILSPLLLHFFTLNSETTYDFWAAHSQLNDLSIWSSCDSPDRLLSTIKNTTHFREILRW